MKTTEMVSPSAHPVDAREGHISFEPFSPAEWAITILLALICFGIPVGAVIHYNREMARLDAAALAHHKGGEACPSSRVSFGSSTTPAGTHGSAGGSTTSRFAVSGGRDE